MSITTILCRTSDMTMRCKHLATSFPVFSVRSSLLKRCFSSSQSNQRVGNDSVGSEDSKERVKIRRAYAIGGSLAFVWLSMHALLLYRRRAEYRSLNRRIPPLSWEDFVEKYLLRGEVKTIVFQPQFEVGNVYLHSSTEEQMKRVISEWIHAAPDKFFRPPDVRFSFDGDESDVKKAILELQNTTSDTATPLEAVEIEIDQFPSRRELIFIAISTLFTLAAATSVVT